QLKETLDTFFLNYTDSGPITFYMPGNDMEYFLYVDNIENYPQTLLGYSLEAFLNTSEFEILTSLQAAAVYRHSPTYLWAFYGTAIGASTIVSIIAMTLVYSHGAPSAKGFSHLLVMTRNPSLLRIVQEAPLGAHQLTDNRQDINLRFGRLGKRYDNDIEMVGFGVDKEDTVSPLTKPKAVELWEE
ncbi:7904_t:CDS:1, partial [Acaulospora colombiana]